MTRTNADVLHLGCGEDYHNDAWNVDAVPDVEPDEVYNLEKLPWPWDDNSFGTIRAFHLLEHLEDIEAALREAQRLLRSGGTLVVKVPMGVDATADPDHVWGGGYPWTWRTPTFLTGARHWDVDVGLEVVHRNVDMWSHRPTIFQKGFDQAIWEWRLQRHGPGPWCFSQPAMSGEFTVVFENNE